MRPLILLLTLLLVGYTGTAWSDNPLPSLPEPLPTATSATTVEVEEDEVHQVGDYTTFLPMMHVSSLISRQPQQALVYAREDRSLWLWQPSQEPRQLTVARPLDNPEQPANENAYLNWEPSPDGRYLLYSHGKSPVLTASPTGGIHLVPLTTPFDDLPVEQTLVEEAFSAAEFEVPFRLPEGAVAWSPDSQQLAFVSYHELPTGALYVTNLDDLTARRVADWPARALTWSPDGTYLAFMRADLQTNMGAHLLVWLPADGSAPARLLEASVHDELEVAWTDSSKLVAHIHAELEPGVLATLSQFVMIEPIDGTRTVLYEQYRVRVSDWSEEQDAFVAALYNPEQGATGLYLIRTNGTVEPLVTDDPHIAEEPFYMSWSPDGRHIIWRSDLGACQHNLLELSTGERQTWPYCNFGGMRWSPDNRYLYTHWGEIDSEEMSSTLIYRVFEMESGTLVVEGIGPTQLSGSQASWSLSANGRYVATIHRPQRYLGKGTAVATANLYVDEWRASGNLVDEQATTWGPGIRWIPKN
jgi:WD40 repeat protein